MSAAESQVIWRDVACPYCSRRVSAGELAEHEEECAKQAHETSERFE